MWPRWLRATIALWVAWDSRRRRELDVFWVLVLLLLGPLLLPVYLAARPLLHNETRRGSFLWNCLWNIEKLLSALLALATAAVFVENMTLPPDRNLAEVKRAEIKAGTLLGTVAVIILFIGERLGFDALRNHCERRFPEQAG